MDLTQYPDFITTDEGTRCTICNVNIKRKKYNMNKHLQSKSHRDRISDSHSHYKLQQSLKDNPDFEIKDNKLFCKLCDSTFNPSLFSLDRHMKTDLHTFSSTKNGQKQFNNDLTDFMIQCNIPWSKLDNPTFRNFMENLLNNKYGNNVNLPSESNIRLKYLPKIYEEKKDQIRQELQNKTICLSVDETTDSCGKKVANVLIQALDGTSSKMHLFASKVLEETNYLTTTGLVNETLKDLWGQQYNENLDKLLFFITDAGSYMLKAGKCLTQEYPNLTHVTCFAHGLNRVAEKVRSLYPKINKLIDCVKKVFLKAPVRTKKFRMMYPNISLPPRPVITRWGTWLNAASYYNKYYNEIKAVIDALDSREARAIVEAKKIFRDRNLKSDLLFVDTNFNIIAKSIQLLEDPKLELKSSLKIVSDLIKKMAKLRLHPTGKEVYFKLKYVLKKNPGYSTVKVVQQLIEGKEVDMPEGVNKSCVQYFKELNYLPVTSVNVERSFSYLKWIFSNRRERLTAKSVEHILVIYSM